MPFAIHMLYVRDIWVLFNFPKVHDTHIPWERDSQAHLGQFMKSWTKMVKGLTTCLLYPIPELEKEQVGGLLNGLHHLNLLLEEWA